MNEESSVLDASEAHEKWARKMRELQDEARAELGGLMATPEYVTKLVAAARRQK